MTENAASQLGRVWFDALAVTRPHSMDLPSSVLVGGTGVDGDRAALIAVVPNPGARFPRARNGEMGLEEGWGFAQAIEGIVHEDAAADLRRPIIVLVDVPSQAYGYVEELAGIHQSLAASANALATARLAGHPVTALVVGKAISGAFLAIGLQANRIVLLDHDGIVVQVMSKQSAARITRRTVAELDDIAQIVPATAYDGASFAQLGAVHAVIPVNSPATPSNADVLRVIDALTDATQSARADGTGLASRLDSTPARSQRAASRLVRERVSASWDA
ncbi:biotin-independent malonate decarboxylase subunit gamma [Cryobacterium sp. AP23]